jgi:hypothetical protein
MPTRRLWQQAREQSLNKATAKELAFLKMALAADAAGHAAATATTPVPMIVTQHKNMVDDSSPVEKQWYVEGGVCGFAWVIVRPATSSFAKWAKKNLPHTHIDYYGGLSISSGLMTQSMERNMAYCSAYAKVLNEAGIRAHMNSRID